MQVRLHRTLAYLEALLGVHVPAGVLADLRAGATFVDRADHAFQAHGQGPLGAIPELACAFSRGNRGAGAAGWARFPRYVADAWEVDGPAALPAGALRRIRRRLPAPGGHR